MEESGVSSFYAYKKPGKAYDIPEDLYGQNQKLPPIYPFLPANNFVCFIIGVVTPIHTNLQSKSITPLGLLNSFIFYINMFRASYTWCIQGSLFFYPLV